MPGPNRRPSYSRGPLPPTSRVWPDCRHRCATSASVRDRRAARRFAGSSRSSRLPKNHRRLLVRGRGTCRARTAGVVTDAGPPPPTSRACRHRWSTSLVDIVIGLDRDRRAALRYAAGAYSSRLPKNHRRLPVRGAPSLFGIAIGGLRSSVTVTVGLRGVTQDGESDHTRGRVTSRDAHRVATVRARRRDVRSCCGGGGEQPSGLSSSDQLDVGWSRPLVLLRNKPKLPGRR